MLMMMIQPAVASAGTGTGTCTRRFAYSGGLRLPWKAFRTLNEGSFERRGNILKNRVQASAEHSGLDSDPMEHNGKPQYHPFEEIGESAVVDSRNATLTPAETTRTIIEVNSKATLMFSSLVNGEAHENIFWPGLPYVTDEHGNIYFKVNNDEDIMQSLTSENNFVQVIIGFDTMEMFNKMELSRPSEINFGLEEIEDEDSDFDNNNEEDDDDDDDEDEDEDENYEKDWVSILEDEGDEEDSDANLGDWAKLETMRSSHPMYFAKKLVEVVAGDPIDWMGQASVGLTIQGLLTPAYIDEHSSILKHISGHHSSTEGENQAGNFIEEKVEDLGMINGHTHESGLSENGSTWADELEPDENLRSGTSFYKLEMIKIQLVSADGHQTAVEVEDFWKARPDVIAHSAPKIITQLNAGEEKTLQALKSLCWRCKGIQVEEATLIGVDALGFDLRVCSETQVQTLRFAFNTRIHTYWSCLSGFLVVLRQDE
ncbi:uncharacterized protein At3g49140-like isoform X2 [Malania oleifera]|uniref:uncharacterized protein At3g49140-like isoform X2 n=1 Tax=Malania oleifera TaxID=397392 RepID=UPI0025AE8482|nr:uncharacterized protein At3g49140-like isoform X2 [Malania oleifera]